MPLLALMVSGVFFRLLSITGPFGYLDSDEAVTGLMARQIMHGVFPTFFWGQAYGGTAEALFVAPFVALAPGDPLALRATALIEGPLIAVVIWRILLRSLSPRRAAFAAAAAFGFPTFTAYFSARAELFYQPILLLGLLLMLLSLRFFERPADWRNPLMWGLAAGIGWWLGPTIAIYAIASLVWVIWRARSRLLLRAAFAAVPAFLLGAAPWVAKNFFAGFPSLQNPPRIGTYAEHAQIFFEGAVPTMFGLRTLDGQQWILPIAISVALVVIIAGVLVRQSIVLTRGWNPLSLPLLPGVLIIIFAIPFSYTVANGRYDFYVAPLAIAVLAAAVGQPRIVAVVVVLALLANVVSADKQGMFSTGVAHTLASLGTGTNPTDEQLIAHLEKWHVTRLYADYWLAYRDDYLSNGKVVITPFETTRSRGIARQVNNSADPAYLFSSSSRRIAWLNARLRHLHIGYTDRSVAGFTVVVPAQRVPVARLGVPQINLSGTVPFSRLPPP